MEIGKTLASKGAKVILWDIVPPSQSLPSNIEWFHCDVSSNLNVQEQASLLFEKVGEPTILINNAGVTNGKLVTDLSEDDVLR